MDRIGRWPARYWLWALLAVGAGAGLMHTAQRWWDTVMQQASARASPGQAQHPALLLAPHAGVCSAKKSKKSQKGKKGKKKRKKATAKGGDGRRAVAQGLSGDDDGNKDKGKAEHDRDVRVRRHLQLSDGDHDAAAAEGGNEASHAPGDGEACRVPSVSLIWVAKLLGEVLRAQREANQANRRTLLDIHDVVAQMADVTHTSPMAARLRAQFEAQSAAQPAASAAQAASAAAAAGAASPAVGPAKHAPEPKQSAPGSAVPITKHADTPVEPRRRKPVMPAGHSPSLRGRVSRQTVSLRHSSPAATSSSSFAPTKPWESSERTVASAHEGRRVGPLHRRRQADDVAGVTPVSRSSATALDH